MNRSGYTYRFPKREKLTGKKSIEELFKNGSSFYLHPLLVRYLPSENDGIDFHRLLFTVPKKNFKRAVDRNLLKRRMREAYRLNKYILLDPQPRQYYNLGFVYTNKTVLTYAVIEEKLKLALLRLQNQNPQDYPLSRNK